MVEFRPFQKIPRLYRDIIITEKIDGTNGIVHVEADGTVLAGSRNRWITPESDNMGFARWVKDHEDELRVGLGPGTHYGEWWGAGIQRRYGLQSKRFSLFNTARWSTERPMCCDVVPVLYHGPNSDSAIESAMDTLLTRGSQAAPGFMSPEGIVVYHAASGQLFKVTLENDGKPKSKAA